MFQAVSDWSCVPDPLTDALLDDAELVDLPTALQKVHFPNSWMICTRTRAPGI
jgi:hypothetical protein